MGMLVGVGIAAIVAAAVALMLRAKPAVSAAPVAAIPTAAAPPPAVVDGPFERVTLEVQGTVYGAVPPFGQFDDAADGVVFTAQSRVVAADDGGMATGDGASTIQSLGTMEFGEFRYTFTADDVKALDVGDGEPETALHLNHDGKTHRLVGLGGRGVELATWLRDHG